MRAPPSRRAAVVRRGVERSTLRGARRALRARSRRGLPPILTARARAAAHPRCSGARVGGLPRLPRGVPRRDHRGLARCGAREDDRDTGRAVGPVAPHRQAARVRRDHPPRLRRWRPRRASSAASSTTSTRSARLASSRRRRGAPNDAARYASQREAGPDSVVPHPSRCDLGGGDLRMGGVLRRGWRLLRLGRAVVVERSGRGDPDMARRRGRLLRRVGNRRLHALAPRRNGAAQSRSPRTARRYATTCRPRTRGNRRCGRHADARALRHRG